MALFGSTDAVTAAPVASESISAPAALADDRLVTTANVIDTGETVTLTSDPVGTTYVAGTDYTVTAAGVVILAAGGISASDPLLISYTKKAVDVVQALVQSAQEYELVFDGVNEAQNDAPFVAKVHRAKFGGSAVPLIGDDFGSFELSGDALKDTSITTQGLSQFVEIKAA